MTSPCVIPPEVTRIPPNQTIAITAKFIIKYVSGFKSAESFPTRMAVSVWSLAAVRNRASSWSCFENARMTRAPLNPSREISEIRSSFFCMTLKYGTDRLMTK